MLKALKHQRLSITWLVFILYICNSRLSTASKAIRFFEGFDKVVHLGLFFVLTVLLFHGRQQQNKSYQYTFITLLKIAAFTFVFGGGIEIMQWKIFTYRAGDWWDLFADMLGVFMAMFSYIMVHRKNDFKFNSLKNG